MRILLIEDDMVLGDGLCEGLRLGAHTVDWLTDGVEAESALQADEFDAAILDLALPKRSGLDVVACWRRAEQYLPVLVLSAHEPDQNCVAALDAGADEFVTKPVSLEELEARLRALARRPETYASDYLRWGAVCLDQQTRTAWLEQVPLDLTAYQFIVLEALLKRPESTVSREYLEARLYGWENGPESNSLEVLIHRLRAKLGSDRIRTVRGLGYRLARRKNEQAVINHDATAGDDHALTPLTV